MTSKVAFLGLAASAMLLASAAVPVGNNVWAQSLLNAKGGKGSAGATVKWSGSKSGSSKSTITKSPVTIKSPPARTTTRKSLPVAKDRSIVAKKQPALAVKRPLIVEKPPVVAKKRPVAAKKPPVVVKKPPIAVKKPPIIVKKPPVVVKKPPVIVAPHHYRRWRPGLRWRWIVVPTIIIADYLDWCHYHLYRVAGIRFHRNIECHQHDWWDHPSVRYVEAY